MGILKRPPPCFPRGQEASRGLSGCSLTWDLSPPSPSRMAPVMGGFLPPCILSLKPFILLLGPASSRASSSTLPEHPQEGHSCPPGAPPAARASRLRPWCGLPVQSVSCPVAFSKFLCCCFLFAADGNISTKDNRAMGPFSVTPELGEMLVRYQEGLYFPCQVPKVINIIFMNE